MNLKQENIESTIYNLILNPHTREWEREQLRTAQKGISSGMNFAVEIDKLEAILRPLAVRNNLTPDVTDFYNQITGKQLETSVFDLSRHYAKDELYQERAIFAGGCFWCMVEPFEKRAGIVAVFSGYTGGHVDNPSYEQVTGQYTGHVEAVEIIFDKRVVSYQDLVTLYWQLTDPTDEGGQFADRGDSYRPVIFVKDQEQREVAEKSKRALENSGMYTKPIVTRIEPTAKFWPAENFHQEFYKKNPKRYQHLERERTQFLRYLRFKGWFKMNLRRFKVIK